MARRPLRLRRPSAGWVAWAMAVVVLIGTLAGCGDDEDSPSDDARGRQSTTTAAPACDPAVDEPLDPRSPQHLLPGAPEPEYQTDPPTSGPHDGRPAIAGEQAEPVARPMQVTVLEVGGVLLQYQPDAIDQEGRATLTALAGEQVVVAPNPSLPAPVVATAWTVKMTCRAVDRVALEGFVSTHLGGGPGEGG